MGCNRKGTYIRKDMQQINKLNNFYNGKEPEIAKKIQLFPTFRQVTWPKMYRTGVFFFYLDIFKTRLNRLFVARHAPSSTASSINIRWDRVLIHTCLLDNYKTRTYISTPQQAIILRRPPFHLQFFLTLIQLIIIIQRSSLGELSYNLAWIA